MEIFLVWHSPFTLFLILLQHPFMKMAIVSASTFRIWKSSSCAMIHKSPQHCRHRHPFIETRVETWKGSRGCIELKVQLELDRFSSHIWVFYRAVEQFWLMTLLELDHRVDICWTVLSCPQHLEDSSHFATFEWGFQLAIVTLK